jgi:hypothetical protein
MERAAWVAVENLSGGLFLLRVRSLSAQSWPASHMEW